MKRFFVGFLTYFRGLKLWLSHRTLIKLSIIPFFLDLLAFIAGIYFALKNTAAIAAHFVHSPDTVYHFVIYYVTWAVTALSLFLIFTFLVFILANLLAFPFNDLLAEKTLGLQNALPITQTSSKAWAQKRLTNLGAMLKKIPILVMAGVIMTGAAFIPGLGIFAAAIGVFLMAVDRLDYASDQHQLTFQERIRFVRENFLEVAGFAAALGVTTALPLFNIFLMPGGVVAGSLLFAQLRLNKKE